VLSLGISYQMHDSAACLVRDGRRRIVAAVAEERLSRIKHDAAFPVRAILECLRLGDARPDDLGNPPHFATWRGDSKLRHEDVGWDLHRKFYSGVKSHLKPGASAVLQENQLGSSPDIFEPMIRGGGGAVIGTVPGSDLGPGGRIYYVHSRWD